MEAKRQREEALDRNKDRLREENRQIFEERLERLLEGEAQMALEKARECVHPVLLLMSRSGHRFAAATRPPQSLVGL